MSEANDRLLRDFAIRAVEAQPLGYLHSLLSGVAFSVEWPRRPYPDPGTMYYYSFHLTPQAIPANHSWTPGGTAYSDAVRYGHAVLGRVVRPFAILIDGWERVFYTYGPLFGLILLTGLGGVLRLRWTRERGPRLAWSRRAGSMLLWFTAVVLLVFPIAVADFDYRYLLPVLPCACLAAGLAFAPASPGPAAGIGRRRARPATRRGRLGPPGSAPRGSALPPALLDVPDQPADQKDHDRHPLSGCGASSRRPRDVPARPRRGPSGPYRACPEPGFAGAR